MPSVLDAQTDVSTVVVIGSIPILGAIFYHLLETPNEAVD